MVRPSIVSENDGWPTSLRLYGSSPWAVDRSSRIVTAIGSSSLAHAGYRTCLVTNRCERIGWQVPVGHRLLRCDWKSSAKFFIALTTGFTALTPNPQSEPSGT